MIFRASDSFETQNIKFRFASRNHTYCTLKMFFHVTHQRFKYLKYLNFWNFSKNMSFISWSFCNNIMNHELISKPGIACLKLTMETLEQGVKYVQN